MNAGLAGLSHCGEVRTEVLSPRFYLSQSLVQSLDLQA